MIDLSLEKFFVLKEEIRVQLAAQIKFAWRVYKGRKARLIREEEERKAAKKARKGKKKGKGRSNLFASGKSRKNSSVAGSGPSPNKKGKKASASATDAISVGSDSGLLSLGNVADMLIE